MPAFTKNVDSIVILHTALDKALKALSRLVDNAGSFVDAMGITLTGPAGTGKSTVVLLLKKKYPSEITETKNKIPILVATIPAVPTIKGVAMSLLYELGDPYWDKRSVSENKLTQRLIHLMQKCEVQALVLDESQHFADKNSDKENYNVSNWLKALMDQSRIVTILVGLPKLNQIINGNEQISRRFENGLELERFDWDDERSRQEFLGVLNSIQKMLKKFSFPKLASEEMGFRFYVATGGLIAYVIKILRTAVWNAIDEKRTEITIEDLAAGWETSIRKVAYLNGCNPFSETFDSIPRNESIDAAKEVGKEVMPMPPKRRGPKSKKNQW